MIDEDYKRSLEQRGVVHIPGVVDPDLIRDARDKVHATLNDQVWTHQIGGRNQIPASNGGA